MPPCSFIEEQIEAGALDGGVARCRATTRKGKPCQRTPLPERDYCPSHQHLERIHQSCCVAGTGGRLPHAVSHDTDKLIRQLSLVAFLMAERRPLTARDVKQQRRGLLGDVRRGVRAPVLLRPGGADRPRRPAPVAARRVHRRGALHAPLRAVLPAAARALGRRARGAPDLLLPARGEVRLRGAAAPRAPEPRPRPARIRQTRRPKPRAPSRSATPTTRPRCRAGSAKLENAISKQRTVKFRYWSISRDEEQRAHAQPVRAPPRRGVWYVIGHDLDRDDVAHLPRLAHPRRHPLRDAARARLPASRPTSTSARTATGRRGRSATPPARRGSRSAGRHGVVGRARVRRRRARSRTASSSRRTRASACSPPGSCARTAAPSPSRLTSCGARSPARCARSATRTRARRPSRPARLRPSEPDGAPERPARPGRARALRRPPGAAGVPARRLRRRARGGDPGPRARRAVPHPGGGSSRSTCRCSTSSTSAAAATPSTPSSDGDHVHVDKELYGDTFRSAPAPDAARGARDPARARVRRADGRRRLAHPARPRAPQARGDVRHVRARADAGTARGHRGGAARPSSSRRRSATTGWSRSST